MHHRDLLSAAVIQPTTKLLYFLDPSTDPFVLSTGSVGCGCWIVEDSGGSERDRRRYLVRFIFHFLTKMVCTSDFASADDRFFIDSRYNGA